MVENKITNSYYVNRIGTVLALQIAFHDNNTCCTTQELVKDPVHGYRKWKEKALHASSKTGISQGHSPRACCIALAEFPFYENI